MVIPGMMYVKLRSALSICDTWPAFFAMKSSYMRSHPGDCASAAPAPAPALWPRVVLCISISPFSIESHCAGGGPESWLGLCWLGEGTTGRRCLVGRGCCCRSADRGCGM